jgi:hypothetical protein
VACLLKKLIHRPGTPKRYARQVSLHCNTTIENSLYSGQDYRRLAVFLNRPFEANDPTRLPPEAGHDDGFALLYELRPKIPASGIKLSRTLAPQSRQPDHNTLIFLNGYPSPEWLNELGAKYNIDPEFFHRHLSFLSRDDITAQDPAFTLPSFQRTIFQMTVTSIGVHNIPFDGDIEVRRSFAKSQMENYTHALQSGKVWNPRQSVVRSYNVYDKTQFSIEQNLTIYVTMVDKERKRWLGKLSIRLTIRYCLTLLANIYFSDSMARRR